MQKKVQQKNQNLMKPPRRSVSCCTLLALIPYHRVFAVNYQKEVRNQEGWILKDTGTGFRPLAK